MAGEPSAKALAAALESINFVRAMTGLDAVSFAENESAAAQQAALMMAAEGSLSHTPGPDWACYSKQYLDDAGSGNDFVGHRRWILNPPTQTWGYGLTSTTNALYVFGPPVDDTNANPRWVSWPTPGWFPAGLQPAGRWSLSSGNDGADFSAARVRVTRGDDRLAVKTNTVRNGYGQPTLVFQVRA